MELNSEGKRPPPAEGGEEDTFAALLRVHARPPVTHEQYAATRSVTMCVQTASPQTVIDGRGWHIPVVELYGTNAEKQSVCLRIEDFRPYFFVQIPRGAAVDTLADFCTLLDRYLSSRGVRKRCGGIPNDQPLVTHWQVHDDGCQSILGYRPPSDTLWLLRIGMAVPGLIRPAQMALEKGEVLPMIVFKT